MGDNNRVARATGATIVSRTDEILESDVGEGCGLFEVRKLGDEYFAFLEECDDPKACTILLRGGSKDVLNEIERNLQDAMQVIRNVVLEPRRTVARTSCACSPSSARSTPRARPPRRGASMGCPARS